MEIFLVAPYCQKGEMRASSLLMEKQFLRRKYLKTLFLHEQFWFLSLIKQCVIRYSHFFNKTIKFI